MSVNIDPANAIKGIQQTWSNFTNRVLIESWDIVHTSAQMILNNTIPFTPVDTGALRASGVVRSEILKGPSMAVGEISFGGSANSVTPTRNAPTGVVDYAIKVHEGLFESQRFHVGGPGFLIKGAAATNLTPYLKSQYGLLVK